MTELLSISQSFRSYEQLLGNPNINISHKKLREMCKKCAEHCLKINSLTKGETK